MAGIHDQVILPPAPVGGEEAGEEHEDEQPPVPPPPDLPEGLPLSREQCGVLLRILFNRTTCNNRHPHPHLD